MYQNINNTASTAKEVLAHKINNAKILTFLLDKFTEFAADYRDWQIQLDDVGKQFDVYVASQIEEEALKSTLPEGKSISMLISSGITFLATHPIFSISEFVKEGAHMQKKEMLQFTEELRKALKKPSTREKIAPYIAVVGYKVVQFIKDTNKEMLETAIDQRVASIRDAIGASVVKSLTVEKMEPWQKALQVLDTLEEIGISIDKDGNPIDPKNIIQKEILKNEHYAREQSQKGTTGRSTEGFPETPENLN